MNINIYLAARYSRLEQMQGYRDVLTAAGHTVTSRWINGDHQVEDLTDETADEARERFALEDMEDLARAQVTIAFTEVPRSSNSRGGRHVELGAALAFGQTVVVVGPRENVFCCLPQVSVFEDMFQVLLFLQSLSEAAALRPPARYERPPSSLFIEDGDLERRAQAGGLRVEWISESDALGGRLSLWAIEEARNPVADDLTPSEAFLFLCGVDAGQQKARLALIRGDQAPTLIDKMVAALPPLERQRLFQQQVSPPEDDALSPLNIVDDRDAVFKNWERDWNPDDPAPMPTDPPHDGHPPDLRLLK